MSLIILSQGGKVSQPTVNEAASERVNRWHHRLESEKCVVGLCPKILGMI